MRKWIVWIICFFVGFYVTACGKADTDLQIIDESSAYSRQEIDTGNLPPIMDISLTEHYLYLLVCPLAGSVQDDGVIRQSLYRIDLADADMTPEKVPFEIQENEYVAFIDYVPQALEDQESCFLLRNTKGETNAYEIIALAEDGTVKSQTDATKYLKEPMEMGMTGALTMDAGGNLYAAAADRLLSWDNSFKKKEETKNGLIQGFSYDGQGNLYCFWSTPENRLQLAQVLGGKDRKSAAAEHVMPIMRCSGYLSYWTDDGVWEITGQQSQKLVSFPEVSVDASMAQRICIAPDKSIYLSTFQAGGDGVKTALYRLSPAQTKDTFAPVVITMGGCGMDDSVKKAVAAFHQSQSEIFIQIEDYGNDEAAEKKLLLDIMDGDGIDLLCVPDRYMLKNPEKYLENLYREDLFADISDHVKNAYCKNGDCYFISPSYAVHTMVWNADHDVITADRIGQDPLFDMDKKSVLHQLLIANQEELFQNGSIDVTLLHQLVAVCGRYPDTTEETVSVPAFLLENEDRGAVVDIMEPNDWGLLTEMLPQISFHGIPAEQGGVSSGGIVPMGGMYAILRHTEKKEAAYAFLAFLLSDTYQFGCYPEAFPITEKAMDRMFQIISADHEQELADGSHIRPYTCEIGYDGYVVTLDAFTSDEVRRLKDFLYHADSIFQVDPQVLSIVEEEIGSYYDGVKSLEQTDDMIQRRIETYWAEQNG